MPEVTAEEHQAIYLRTLGMLTARYGMPIEVARAHARALAQGEVDLMARERLSPSPPTVRTPSPQPPKQAGG